MPCGALIRPRDRPAVVSVMRIGEIPEIRVGDLAAEVPACRFDLSAAVSDRLIVKDTIVECRDFPFAAQVCQGLVLYHETRSDLGADRRCADKPRCSSSKRRHNSRNLMLWRRRHSTTMLSEAERSPAYCPARDPQGRSADARVS